MSKITFRADDDLVEQLEGLEISKSEAMREALRSYLGAEERPERGGAGSETGAIDDLIRRRVDELLADRLDELDRDNTRSGRGPEEVTVSVSLAGDTPETRTRRETDDRETTDPPADPSRDRSVDRPQTPEEVSTSCGQCGEEVAGEHVYCPNCGEKASRRLFCECGDEIRSDWSFCPGCGRRTPAADVLGTESQS